MNKEKEEAIQAYINFQFSKMVKTPTYQRLSTDLVWNGNCFYTDEDIKQMMKEADELVLH